MFRFALTFVLLLAGLVGQQIRVANYSSSPYDGWLRRTVDQAPPHDSGQVDGASYVLGRRVGIACRVIDLRVRLGAGDYHTFDLGAAKRAEAPDVILPDDPLGHFGAPVVSGTTLALRGATINGAGLDVHFAARVGRMLWVDLWATYYQGQPWVQAEVLVTCSNPTTPDMAATVPGDFRLRFGDADVLVPGLALGASLLAAGETLADGQARAWPCTIVWRRHIQDPDQWASAGAAWSLGVAGVGLQSIGALGPCLIPPSFDPVAWMRRYFVPARDTLHSWREAPLGVAAKSGQTGAQEDQGAQKGNEAMHPRGAGAEILSYLVALGQVRRPCHHLNADGTPLRTDAHPQLCFWDARAHYSRTASPDQLGKPRAQDSVAEAHGWAGPDVEHDMWHRGAAALELTGSPLLQRELEHLARVFWFTDTVDPAKVTSSAWGARAAWYSGQRVVDCWRLLDDRALAERIAQRWRERVLRIYVPRWGGHALDVFDHRDDPRILSEIGPGWPEGWMPYQQAVGVLGLHLASSICGPPEGLELARRGALAVVQHGYSQQGTRWLEWDMVAYTGLPLDPAAYTERQGAHRTGWFSEAWFPLGVWTCLQGDPQNERARAIWAQMRAGTSDGTVPADWLPGQR